MIHVIHAAHPDDALNKGLELLERHSNSSDSRNGEVVVATGPVVTNNFNPRHRVMFSAVRDANPFFHLTESVWMLAGRNDVAFPAHYAKQLELYSDDGDTLNGAYGWRWRQHFQYDQLEAIINELSANPASRRCVLAMWDGQLDLSAAMAGSKDVPCNTHIYFDVDTQHDRLRMTVCCRSNDAVWGAHGANVVHFSFLQEYVAASLGLGMGQLVQFSNNYHIYSERPDVQKLVGCYNPDNRYATAGYELASKHHIIRKGATVEMRRTWREEATFLMDSVLNGSIAHARFASITDPFLSCVVAPLMLAHAYYKSGQHQRAYELSLQVSSSAPDWSMACMEWMQRRKDWKGPTV